MFGLVYVILPISEVAPAEAIASSLARFHRGGHDDLPDEWLTWRDRTAEVEALHRTAFTFIRDAGLRIEGGDSWLLDTSAVRSAMNQRDLERWSVRFADIEPNLASFARDYLRPIDRHPVTQGFGSWCNPLGRWDWWDLGGCFDGAITGQRRRGHRSLPDLSSGPSPGRDMFERLSDALGATPDEATASLDIQADDNIELLSRLAEELSTRRELRLPTDLLLPLGTVDENERWLTGWPNLRPMEPEVWRQIVQTTYARFEDHWAAGVAFHF